MKTMQYNKLVRDRIPEIIEASGKHCTTEILSDAEYLNMLDAKLDEELAEYHKDQNIEELADLLEVICACTVARGYSLAELERVRAEKAAKRGGFEKKILLNEVFSNEDKASLAATIYTNRDAILKRIDRKMLLKYFWLQDNLLVRNVSSDAEYRRKFTGYYRMRFISQSYKDCFFATLEEQKSKINPSFRYVSTQLYCIDGKHEFSFISKLLHTIDPYRPIYDSQVAIALGINRGYSVSIEEKLSEDEKILQQISRTYDDLEKDERIQDVILAFDRLLPERIMTNEKKLDFILWALGAVMKDSR